MKIVTFNIRCDCGADDNNNFEFRKPYILKKINIEKPDIICFQEVMSHVVLWLNDSLTDYIIVGCGREENMDGEQVSIAFRRDRFSLIALDHFWHSDTPYTAGSHYIEQSIFPRLCTQCYLMERESRMMIRVVNTHLDHISSDARRKELQLIMKMISEPSMYKEQLTFFVGDLNAVPDSDEMKVLNAYPEFVCLTNDIGMTYHGYFLEKEFNENSTSPQIDYIFARGDVNLSSVEKWTDEQNGVYLSDHYPVSVIVEIKNNQR